MVSPRPPAAGAPAEHAGQAPPQPAGPTGPAGPEQAGRAPQADLQDLPERILFFDGVCNLCNAAVRFVLARDPGARFSFAPLQGRAAAALRTAAPDLAALRPAGGSGPGDASAASRETLVLLDRSGTAPRVLVRSDAVLAVLRELESPLRHLGWLRALPRPLRDALYRLVAGTRYRLFGRSAACRLPTAAERARFLD